jgi:regulatory associated protein of mTOR
LSAALGGINEEPSPLPSPSDSVQYRKHDGGHQQQQDQRQRGRKLDQADMRRVASEIVTGGVSSMEDNALRNSSLPTPTGRKPSEVINYSLPKSEFYEWKKEAFDPNFHLLDGGDVDNDDDDNAPPLDALSPLGAAKAYQEHRNFIVREQGRMLGQRYASLAPKPPKPKKQSIEQILEEEDEAELAKAEEEASAKKRELELNEKCIFRNQGVKMTSLVAFHPYEDYLVACGVNDAFLWNTESGERLSMFSNKNPKGSRITSACWVNEEAASLFLIGCDDGTVKVWGDLQDGSTGIGTQQPTLVSAFQAAPMEPGHWGSGLVMEWQPFSGTLIAGGNSKLLRCWNLEVEKVVNKMETIGDAYITTLTTAWDYESLGTGQSRQGSLGISPDVVVAGHSDGSLKIFDIRINGIVNEMRESSSRLSTWRPRQRITSYLEHKSYVVTTAFTGYGGRYELISGTVSGEVKAWDLRMSSSSRTFDIQRSTMTTLAVHSKIPIMATGSHAQFIKVATLDGDTMQVLRYHEKLANHRIGPVSCLAFHPLKPLLAAGATDSYIGLYTTKQKDHKK